MTNLNTPFMIGNVEIPNRTVLAPWLVSLILSHHRKRARAGLVVMEMVSDKGIQYNNEKKPCICFISMKAKTRFYPTLW